MVKGSHPFRESGKLRVGVAEIEMIPTVGSEISGENPPFGCIKLLNYHVNLRRVSSIKSQQYDIKTALSGDVEKLLTSEFLTSNL